MIIIYLIPDNINSNRRKAGPKVKVKIISQEVKSFSHLKADSKVSNGSNDPAVGCEKETTEQQLTAN
jgi:hypothetical protein